MIKTDPVNHTFMPCGFLKNGQIRPIYGNSLLGKIKRYHHNQGTSPKLMVCITMYNEDVSEFEYTMKGVLHNLEVMCQDPHIGFKKNDFLVILACDGIDKVPQSMLDYLTKMGVLDLPLLKEKGFASYDETTNRYKMKEIQDFMDEGQDQYPNNLLHLFGSYTDDFGIKDNEYFKGRKINFVFALKHNNNGKINTYKWLLQGVAKYLQPEFVQKIDIGTKPGDYSIAKLYKHMQVNKDCGGACSEVVIATDNEKANRDWGTYFTTMLQFYEYKQTITIFKVFEGWGGFVMALPGCFSMYRYEAIKGEPLQKFFKVINMQQEPTCWEANEYLVEDRLLTNNLYYQKNEGYKTDMVMFAESYTDAPETLEILLTQRRRWANGFLFGELNTLLNAHNIFGFNGQRHSIIQRLKMILYVPLLFVQKTLAWINPAILLSQMKYLIVFTAYAFFNNDHYKVNNPDLYKFMTNDPSSVGIQTVVTYTLFVIMLFTIIGSIGAKLKDMMPYNRVLLAFFQIYCALCQVGTYNAVKNFGFYDKEGHFNVYVLQFVIQWFIILAPFFFRPVDFL
jgi:chitin synthase